MGIRSDDSLISINDNSLIECRQGAYRFSFWVVFASAAGARQSSGSLDRRGAPPLAMTEKSLERSRDQQLHDLAGAAVDALDPGVAPGAGDRIVVDIAVAAVELEAGVDQLAMRLGDPELGDRRGCGVELAGEEAGDAVVDEDPGDHRLGLAVCEHELAGLEVDHWPAEGL